MARYVLQRFLYMIFVFFIVSIIMFIIYQAVPGDPVSLHLSGEATAMTPEQYETLYNQTRERLGLDKPVYIQYFAWMGKMLTGDFGYSTVYKMPVAKMAAAPLLNTVRINLLTLVFVFIITIPLGILSAVKKGSAFDSTVQVITILGYSLPGFIIALLAILLFSVKLEWFPISGVSTAGFTGTPKEVFFDRLNHMILPMMVLVFTSLGSLTRYIRAAMIDALRMDYIRTARAKGVKEKVVIYSHAFRNSLIPVVTVMTAWFISIFSGSIVIERIFSWNGMGKIMIDSLHQLDFAVVMVFQMFYVLLALIGNLVMDLCYMLVDPRIKLM